MDQVNALAGKSQNFHRYTGNAGAPVLMNPLNVTLTCQIVNATNANSTYAIFGWSRYGEAEGNGAGVTITFPDYAGGHAGVKRDLSGSPFYITGAKMLVDDVDQFAQSITVNQASITGSGRYWTVQPQNWNSPANNNTLLLVAPPETFSMPMDTTMWLSGTIIEGATITFTFTLGARSNLSNVFKNENPFAVNMNSFPYGTPITTIQAPVPGGVSANVPMVQAQVPVS